MRLKLLVFHSEPAPETVAVPLEPLSAPMKLSMLESVPPSVTFSVPVPERPTLIVPPETLPPDVDV